ncbi:18194_t:CDS:2 [Gigaspora margarita]|uniref:18194_t:CDS:1 n=1 Tax=Gigaspora margarita TaxID=4874 RepID=A0ABM8VY43_GIGMA|nr:18194_t:CDS:2 [Gigaspora margarita]
MLKPQRRVVILPSIEYTLKIINSTENGDIDSTEDEDVSSTEDEDVDSTEDEDVSSTEDEDVDSTKIMDADSIKNSDDNETEDEVRLGKFLKDSSKYDPFHSKNFRNSEEIKPLINDIKYPLYIFQKPYGEIQHHKKCINLLRAFNDNLKKIDSINQLIKDQTVITPTPVIDFLPTISSPK